MALNMAVIKQMMSGRQLIRHLLILLIMILFFLFFQNIYILPKRDKINNISKRVLALSQEVKEIQLRVDDKSERAAREAEVLDKYRRLEEQLDKTKRMLPTRDNISELLDSLTAPGKRSGVSVLSLLPFPPEDMATLTRLSFKLQLEGRYRNIGKYLNELGNMERLIIVDNVQLSGGDEKGPGIQAQLLVSTYLLKEVP